jgi:S-(hydroxymethyl)glutathione dehydrogenase/alcohol dehydrogenase
MIDLTFKAAILQKSNSDLIFDDIRFNNNLKAGQVLVRVFYSGICGAQINEIQAAKGPDKFLPHLLGHEGYGEVVTVGELVKSVTKGDKVILHWMPGSGIQSDPAQYIWQNKTLNSGWVTTLSEFTVISENRCTKIETDISAMHLPLLGCAATTAAGVLANDSQISLGDSVVVLGVGGVGLLTIEAARASGAYPIVGVDIHENKLIEAKNFGATHVIKKESGDILNEIMGKMFNDSPDIVIETTGSKEMIELAYRLISKKGKAILVGVPKVTEPITIDTLPLHFNSEITGSKGGQTRPEVDIPKYAKLAEKGIYRFDKLPISIFKLEEINNGIGQLKAGLAGRLVIAFGK